MIADLDFVDVGTIMGTFLIGCFLASLVWRLYIGHRHDDRRQPWPSAIHD